MAVKQILRKKLNSILADSLYSLITIKNSYKEYFDSLIRCNCQVSLYQAYQTQKGFFKHYCYGGTAGGVRVVKLEICGLPQDNSMSYSTQVWSYIYNGGEGVVTTPVA